MVTLLGLRSTLFILTGLAAASLPGVASAQIPIGPRPGLRVRVSAAELPGGKLIGTLSPFGGDTLVVGKTRIPVAWVSALERRTGRRSHWLAGMGIGALVGAAFGAFAGAADDNCLNKSACIPFGAAAFGVIGLPVGLVVGLLVRTDRWQHTTLDQLQIELRGGNRGPLGVTVSLQF